MKTSIEIFSHMLAKVTFFSKQLNLKISKRTGRPLAIKPEETSEINLEVASKECPPREAYGLNRHPSLSHQERQAASDNARHGNMGTWPKRLVFRA